MSTPLCERAHPKAFMAWAGCFDFCNTDVTPKVAETSRVKCNRQVPTFSRSARRTRLAPQTPRGTTHCSGCSALTSRLVAFRRPSSSGRLRMYAGVDAMEKQISACEFGTGHCHQPLGAGHSQWHAEAGHCHLPPGSNQAAKLLSKEPLEPVAGSASWARGRADHADAPSPSLAS